MYTYDLKVACVDKRKKIEYSEKKGRLGGHSNHLIHCDILIFSIFYFLRPKLTVATEMFEDKKKEREKKRRQ